MRWHSWLMQKIIIVHISNIIVTCIKIQRLGIWTFLSGTRTHHYRLTDYGLRNLSFYAQNNNEFTLMEFFIAPYSRLKIMWLWTFMHETIPEDYSSHIFDWFPNINNHYSSYFSISIEPVCYLYICRITFNLFQTSYLCKIKILQLKCMYRS